MCLTQISSPSPAAGNRTKLNAYLRRFLLTLVFAVLGGTLPLAKGSIINAASVALADVSAAVQSARDGDTVLIPAGTATWTSGVSVSKAIKIVGAGSGRIIAYDDGVEQLTVGSGNLNVKIAGYSPGFGSSSISVGQSLRVSMDNNRPNWMQGVVTAWASPNLTIKVSSTGGTGTAKRWLISTLPSTTIIANNNSSSLFDLTESPNGHLNLSGIQFSGKQGYHDLNIKWLSGGRAVLIHDCWFQISNSGYDSIRSNANRGVVWNCSFDGSYPGSYNLLTCGAINIKDGGNTSMAGSSWGTPSTWGMLDTNGEKNFYVETCDFHTNNDAIDNDDGGRLVFRYNLQDHASIGSHGADTSAYGYRTTEIYNNTGVYYCRNDGTTFNMANGWFGLVRGGTFIVHDNNWTARGDCSDIPDKTDIKMTVMMLNRKTNSQNSCWGVGTSPGSLHYFPRQVGLGYVTGNGVDGKGNSTDAGIYVGDSEPAYVWGNSRTLIMQASDGNECGPTADKSANYIVSGRDYFNGTAKPNYTPYTYPHPLTSGGQTVAPPQNLRVVH
jgi:hypothetical protein